MNWWSRVWRRGRLERELDTELRFHVERAIGDHVRAGLSPAEARRRARLELGGLEQLKEECRDARGTRWVHDAGSDLRFAARLLVKERGLTVVAVLALALGIGVNNMLFTILNAHCIRGLPVVDPGRTVGLAARGTDERDRPLSYNEFADLQTVGGFSGVAAFASEPSTVADEHRAPERAIAAYVSRNALPLFGVQPALGRGFTSGDDRPGAPRVVILGGGWWSQHYDRDPAVIGRSIRVNAAPAVVIGVMPDGFKFPNNADLWLPLAALPDLQSVAAPAAAADARLLGAFARLRDAASLAQVRAEVDAISARRQQLHPEISKDVRLMAVPINEQYNGDITHPAWMAFFIVGIVLVVIACSNVANLLLARSVRRSREIAIRLSLGATRGRIVRQLLAESLLLALAGGMAGLAVSFAGLRLFSSAIPEGGLPYWVRYTMDGRVIAVLASVCLGTVFLFGLAPALHVSKTSVNGVLKDTGAVGAGGVHAGRWTAAFLTVQFALTVLLLSALAAGVELFSSTRGDVTIDAPRLLTMWMTLPDNRYPTAAQRLAFYDRLQERLPGIPSIASGGFGTSLPLPGTPRHVAIEGRAEGEGVQRRGSMLIVDSGYLEAAGLSVVRGRPFSKEDGASGPATAIVDRRFAELFFPQEDPIGRRIRLSAEQRAKPDAPWITIVGIAPTIRYDDDPAPLVYVPFRGAAPATAVLIVRAPQDPAALAPVLREEVRALDPDLPLYRVATLEQAIWEAGWNGRVSRGLITTIALIALGLALVGLGAMTAHAVALRRHEIGVRIALGARGRQVMALVLRRALVQLTAGIIAGIGCTILWTRMFGPADATAPSNLLAVIAVLVAAALAACLWPARRAARLDPLLAIRQE